MQKRGGGERSKANTKKKREKKRQQQQSPTMLKGGARETPSLRGRKEKRHAKKSNKLYRPLGGETSNFV
jgi:hypothetical protein